MLAELIPLEQLRTLLNEVQSDRLLSIGEAAQYLVVEIDDLRGWAAEELIPCERVADQLVFRLRDIVRWEVEGRLQLRVSAETSALRIQSTKPAEGIQ